MGIFKFSSKKNNLNKQLTLKNKDNIFWNILYIFHIHRNKLDSNYQHLSIWDVYYDSEYDVVEYLGKLCIFYRYPPRIFLKPRILPLVA